MLPDAIIRILPANPALGQTSGNLTLTFDRDTIYQQTSLSGDLYLNLATTGNTNGVRKILDVVGDGTHAVYFNNFLNIGSIVFQKPKRNLIIIDYFNGSAFYTIINPLLVGLQDINLVIVGNSIATESGTSTPWHANLASYVQSTLVALGYGITVTFQNGYTSVGQSIPSMTADISSVQSMFDASKQNILLEVGEPLHTFIDAPMTATAQDGADQINTYFGQIKSGHSEWKIVCIAGFPNNSINIPPRADYATIMAACVLAIKQKQIDGINNFDSFVVPDPIFNNNDLSMSIDGLHPDLYGYINGHLIKRMTSGILQALFGTAQPAPITFNTFQYMPLAVPVLFPDNIAQVLSNGIITSNGGNANYGSVGLSNSCLPAGIDGWIGFKHNYLTSNGIIGFKSSYLRKGFATFSAGMVSYARVLRYIDNGSLVSIGSSVTADFFRINRTGSVLTLQKYNYISGAWNILYTYGFSSSAVLYIVSDINDTFKLIYPQGVNISPVIYPFSDTFNRANNASSAGNLENPPGQAWNPVIGTWGTSSNHLVCNTSSGVLLTNVGRTNYVIQATIRTNSSGGLSRGGFVFYYQDASNFFVVEILNSGGSRSLNCYAIAGGGFVQIGTASLSGTAEISALKLICGGNNVEAYENGVLVYSAGGFSFNGSNVGFVQNTSATGGEYFDDFSVI